jgi:hypothetical protein
MKDWNLPKINAKYHILTTYMQHYQRSATVLQNVTALHVIALVVLSQ